MYDIYFFIVYLVIFHICVCCMRIKTEYTVLWSIYRAFALLFLYTKKHIRTHREQEREGNREILHFICMHCLAQKAFEINTNGLRLSFCVLYEIERASVYVCVCIIFGEQSTMKIVLNCVRCTRLFSIAFIIMLYVSIN